MKKIILVFTLLAGALINTSAQEKVTLTVEVEGISSSNGMLRISLFNEAENWLNNPVQMLEIKLIETDTNSFIFRDLLPGEYAVSVIHDENSNGEIDMGMMGPTEDYGFSNNAFNMFGPAAYEDALLNIEQNKTERIKLR